MPKEVRSILFTAEETCSAVAGFLLGRIRGLNPYEVERVEMSVSESAVHARAFLHRSRQGEPAVLQPDELLSAVLLNADPVQPAQVEGNTVVHSAPMPTTTASLLA